MKVFIAGIMQGSLIEREIHDQSYRARIMAVLGRCLPEAEIISPLNTHPLSAAYEQEQARAAFLTLAEEAGQADAVICYLPSASMGTAIEMWQAYSNGRIVLTITPMKHNWVVRFLSTRVFASVDDFETFAISGELARLLKGAAPLSE